jgi:hypothetical protein
MVTQAESSGGGWVPLMFHDICDACYDASVSQSRALPVISIGLKPRAAQGNRRPRTVHEVMDGPTPDNDSSQDLGLLQRDFLHDGLEQGRRLDQLLCDRDTGGSGVASTRYTTDGSSLIAVEPALFRAVPRDEPDHREIRVVRPGGSTPEAAKAVTVKVDTSAPVRGDRLAGAGATVSGPKVSVTAAQAICRSGIAAVDLYVDGVKYATTASLVLVSWSPRKGREAGSTAYGTVPRHGRSAGEQRTHVRACERHGQVAGLHMSTR